MRYAIFVHDPEGDMGYGRVVGPFETAASADRKVDRIREEDADLECIVVPVISVSAPPRGVVDEVRS